MKMKKRRAEWLKEGRREVKEGKEKGRQRKEKGMGGGNGEAIRKGNEGWGEWRKRFILWGDKPQKHRYDQFLNFAGFCAHPCAHRYDQIWHER